MARIKNKSSGIVHAGGTYVHLAMCGASSYSFISLPDCHKVTCKSCLRILKEREKVNKKRICRLPSCEYYSTLATTYCCNACSADAYDDERLSKEEQEMEKKRKNLANQIKRCIDEGHFQSIMLEPKALKILENYIRKHADIYEDTTLSNIITQILENHDGYLKESLF